jgi:hypothetical protein
MDCRDHTTCRRAAGVMVHSDDLRSGVPYINEPLVGVELALDLGLSQLPLKTQGSAIRPECLVCEAIA